MLAVACADPASESPPAGRTPPAADLPLGTQLRPEDRLVEQARALSDAMRRGDHEYVVDAMPKDIVQAGGGRAKLIELAASSGDLAREIAANMELQPPRPVREIGAQMVSVVHYESEMTVDGRGHPMTACWIAFSDDAGSTWSFMSGSKAAREQLRRSRPEVYKVIESDLAPVTLPGVGSLR